MPRHTAKNDDSDDRKAGQETVEKSTPDEKNTDVPQKKDAAKDVGEDHGLHPIVRSSQESWGDW